MNSILTILLSVVLSAQIDSTQIWIGDQTALHLEAKANAGEKVQFPLFDTEVSDGIEVVERGKVDTTTAADGSVSYKQDYIITSFKDSLFYIQPIAFVVDGDTQRTQSLSLNVIQPFEMDTTEAIADIKPVMRPKIWWWGIIRWILLALLLAGLAVGGYYLWRWIKKRQEEKQQAPVNPELLRPCDEVALEKLDHIKAEKAWQSGLHKEYFTQLTDVIREYIARRYDVRSGEKTSDETLAAMKPILSENEQRDLYTKLEKMLRLADLVKFAKWMPTPDENEVSLLAAYTFVKQTAPTEEEKGVQGEAADADFHTTQTFNEINKN